MPTWCVSSTLYKGLLTIFLLLIAIEYFFGTIETRRWEFFTFNSTRQTILEGSVQNIHSPLVKSLLPKHHNNNSYVNDTTNFNKTLINNKTTTEINLLETINFNASEIGEVTERNILNVTSMPLCPEIPPNLQGKVKVVKNPVPSVLDLETKFSWLESGGHYKPDNCKVLKKVAIIIPFRCRGEHLLIFLQHMHPFLKRQLLDYTIFIIEQEGANTFNRAMLMNVGFKEALKTSNFDCFIFHDVDLLPEDDRNIYSCPEQPRHMSVAVDVFKYRLPYPTIFGGVSAISKNHFELLNGFSNMFWGWGGEDDDMSNRIRYHNLHISRYPITIARYTMLSHKKDVPNPKRYDILKNGQKRFKVDGLNNLNYKLVQKKENLLYTWLLVSLEQPS